MLRVVASLDLDIDSPRYQQFLNIKLDCFPNFQEIVRIYVKLEEKKSQQKHEKTNWNSDEISLFVYILIKTSELNRLPINEIAEKEFTHINRIFNQNKQDRQCYIKWFSLQKNYLEKKPWTAQEDLILKQLIE